MLLCDEKVWKKDNPLSRDNKPHLLLQRPVGNQAHVEHADEAVDVDLFLKVEEISSILTQTCGIEIYQLLTIAALNCRKEAKKCPVKSHFMLLIGNLKRPEFRFKFVEFSQLTEYEDWGIQQKIWSELNIFFHRMNIMISQYLLDK